MVVKKDKYYLMLSLCLGKGTIITNQKSNKGKIDIIHQLKNYDYLKYKSELLNTINISNKILTVQKKDVYYSKLITKSNQLLYSISKDVYADGHKVFKKRWIKNLDKLSLAIFWMDRGYLLHRKKKNKKSEIYSYLYGELETFDFDYESNKLIVAWLNKFNIDSYICNYKKNKYIIKINTINVLKLIDIVKEYVKEIPSMINKINP